jgi:hypothetical protein
MQPVPSSETPKPGDTHTSNPGPGAEPQRFNCLLTKPNHPAAAAIPGFNTTHDFTCGTVQAQLALLPPAAAPAALPAGPSRQRTVKEERSSTSFSAFLQVTCSLCVAQNSQIQPQAGRQAGSSSEQEWQECHSRGRHTRATSQQYAQEQLCGGIRSIITPLTSC